MPGDPPALVDLPTELLNLIAEELWSAPAWYRPRDEPLADIRAMRLTCRRFDNVAKPFLYRQITVTTNSELVRFMKHMLNRPECQGLIDAFHTQEIPGVGLNSIGPCSALHTFTNLHHLSLDAGAGQYLLGQLPMRIELFPRLCSFFLFNHACAMDGRSQVEFSKLLPLLTTTSLKRFSICGFDLSFQSSDTTAVPMAGEHACTDKLTDVHVIRELPDLESLTIQHTDRLSSLGKAIRSLRGTKSIFIGECCRNDGSAAYEVIDSFASQLEGLDFLDVTYRDHYNEYDLQRYPKLERLGIRESQLACVRLNYQSREYAPKEPNPRLLLKFPASLEQLDIIVSSTEVHRPTFYRLVTDMMQQHKSLFPRLFQLDLVCYHYESRTEAADYHPDTHHPDSTWSRDWNHNRIAAAENGFLPPKEGDETAECKKLRAICESKGVKLVLRNLMMCTWRG